MLLLNQVVKLAKWKSGKMKMFITESLIFKYKYYVGLHELYNDRIILKVYLDLIIQQDNHIIYSIYFEIC